MKYNLVILMLLIGPLFSLGQTIQNHRVDEGFFVTDPTGQWLKHFRNQDDLTIDHVKIGSGFELFGPTGLGVYLTHNQITHKPLPQINHSILSRYPTPEEIEAELKMLAIAHPDLIKLYSIGKSSQGRNLWVVKLCKNPQFDDQSDARPQFKYIANMHGDEIVGRELMILLIKDLISQYERDPKVTTLLNKVQLHILVSMNPDGAFRGVRGNASGIDLNRSFPDFSTSDNQNKWEGRAPETQAVMKRQTTHRFALSANFHGGAEVVNYPWDTIEETFPQDDFIKQLSLDYAKEASYIGASTVFQNGITNGYFWYEVNGGMQDWSIHWHNDMQVTIELSDSKWPPYEKVRYYYEQNRAALINLPMRLINP